MIDTNDLREAFKRKRYGAGDYDPDFDLFDAAADEINRLRAMLVKIAEHLDTPELIRQYASQQLTPEK